MVGNVVSVARLVAAFIVGLLCISSADARDRNPVHSAVVVQRHVSPVVPGIVYVKFKAGSKVLSELIPKGNHVQSIGNAKWESVLSELGLSTITPFDTHAPKDEITHSLGIDRMYCIAFRDTSIDPHTALQMLLSTGEIENGSARYRFEISKTVDDSLGYEQYALGVMNVYNAWDHTTGDTNVIIADVDCAINVDHEDLKNEIKINWAETGLDKNGHDKRTNGIDDDGDGIADDWQGVDVVGSPGRGTSALVPDGDPRPDQDDMGHGTETAGCIVATANNRVGVAGVAFGCRLLPIKASDNATSIVGGYEGIEWALTHGAKIVNCSWGGGILPAEVPFANSFLQEAVERNVLIVAAAGNNAQNNDLSVPYPSNGPGVLSVGATDYDDAAAYFSDYGRTVAVWAPGSGIWTTSYPGNANYAAVDGTSFSSPYTAGIAALLLSMHPDWTPRYISRQLIQTCDNVISPANRTDYWGRLNAQSAIETAPAGPGLIVTGYAIDGVENDSLRVSSNEHSLSVRLKNVVAPGNNLSAQLLPVRGMTVLANISPIGAIGLDETKTITFQVSRGALYSEGNLVLRFAITDAGSYRDTLSFMLPLAKSNGFSMEEKSIFGSSIKRVSNNEAWAAIGYEVGTVVSEFVHESGGLWDPIGTINRGEQGVYCVEATDDQTAWFGTSSTAGATSIFSTYDAGVNWTKTNVQSITPFVNTIHFFDDDNGIFIGDPIGGRYGIGVTTDGGETWTAAPARPVSSSSETSWNNGTCWVGSHGWFTSSVARIYRSSDNGTTWKYYTTPYNHPLSVAFDADTLHGIATFLVGSGSSTKGELALTSNSGLTWSPLPMPDTTMIPGSVAFVPGSDIAFVSSNHGMYRTSDFGESWSMVGIPVAVDTSIADLDVYRGDGMFTVSLISSDAGIASYQEALEDAPAAVNALEEIPTMTLYPSSPNPAARSTEIAFDLTSRAHIHLVLYDALGREVAIVADGMFSQGHQSVSFDVLNLSPGNYYYTLSAGVSAPQTCSLTVLR